jgi:hypothetical protein
MWEEGNSFCLRQCGGDIVPGGVRPVTDVEVYRHVATIPT